jgi:hypothetical protein
MYDRLLNFLLFKVVFVGAILEPTWSDLYLWVTWFTAIGFLRLFGMCGRDRVDYVIIFYSLLLILTNMSSFS